MRLIDLFEDGLERSFPQYQAAMENGDSMNVRQYAHHNKGPAKMLGLDAFADACETLMQSGAVPDVATKTTTLDDADTLADTATVARSKQVHADFSIALSTVKLRIEDLRKQLRTRPDAPGVASSSGDVANPPHTGGTSGEVQ